MRQPGARAPDYEFDLAHEGARITIPWIVSAEGWAIFFHRPYGAFDLRDEEGRLTPDAADGTPQLDAFFVVSRDPAQIMREYAADYRISPSAAALVPRLHAIAPHARRAASRCSTKRASSGAGNCPATRSSISAPASRPEDGIQATGSSDSTRASFPMPDAMIEQLHDANLRVALHVVDPPLHLSGTVDDTGPAANSTDNAAHYWNEHRPVARTGVDGWWPDVGDKLDPAARLARIRMYWDGPIRDHPDQRPFALHRNGYAGMQRYGWLWSGDIDSTWQTLATQVPVGINCGLTGIPYWGTDIGGFVTTPELTGELFVRWFQFGAFCPLFRAHGRTWKLRLPWGWNTGEYGPEEYDGSRLVPGTLPDRKELRNRRGRADLQGLSRIALSPAALPLFGGARDARNRHAHHARAMAALPVRSRMPSRAATNISGAATSWSRPSSRRARRAARCICRKGPGTISGPAREHPAAARSRGRSTSRRCRSTSAPARSSRPAR